jgi:hypothetical protein
MAYRLGNLPESKLEKCKQQFLFPDASSLYRLHSILVNIDIELFGEEPHIEIQHTPSHPDLLAQLRVVRTILVLGTKACNIQVEWATYSVANQLQKLEILSENTECECSRKRNSDGQKIGDNGEAPAANTPTSLADMSFRELALMITSPSFSPALLAGEWS